MAYDEDLAERIRAAIGDPGGVTEKRMFGDHASLGEIGLGYAASLPSR